MKLTKLLKFAMMAPAHPHSVAALPFNMAFAVALVIVLFAGMVLAAMLLRKFMRDQARANKDDWTTPKTDVENPSAFMAASMQGVIEKLRVQGVPLPYFVMATAYDQYAVEAFRLEALDYLLKPVEKDRLAMAVDRARKGIAERAKAATPSDLPSAKPSLQRSKLQVKSNHRNFIVDAQDVVYATIDDGLITVVAASLEGQSNYRTIEELQSNLDPDMFWRVHRSYLVNINKIKEVMPWFKSSFQLRMDDKKQTEVPVSRVQTKRLRELLKL